VAYWFGDASIIKKMLASAIYGGNEMRKNGDYADKNGKDKATGRTDQVPKDSADFRGYLNVNLSDEQKQHFDVWSQSAAPTETLAYHVADGVNIALRREKGGETFLASATQRRNDSVNAGLCVTARGREPWIAFYRLLFILALLGHSESWEAVQPIASSDRW
jgi:hypothetical protein